MIDYKKVINDFKIKPVYVFDEEGFINNYNNLYNSMKSVYSKYKISYSYKTNYTPYICSLVKDLGGFAEVVSDMEYTLAKKLGYKNSEIVYNGPAKGKCLEEHILNGGIVNIDNYDEAVRISKIQANKQLKVGLRINLDVGANFISRFGLEIESYDFKEAIKVLHKANIKIVGLHCHISRNRSIETWKKRSDIMLEAAKKYIDGIPEYISFGSGMFADMPKFLKDQFSNVPTYKEYANAVLKPFTDYYGDNGPIIFTEPGTTLIARYINFVSKVISIKTIKGRNIATVNGSFENLGEICTLKKLPVNRIGIINENKYDSIDIMGYTCLEQDLMFKDYSGYLSVGDYLIFENVGAYSIVSKPQFIHPNCEMVAIDKNNNIKCIMREETFEDVFSKFKF